MGKAEIVLLVIHCLGWHVASHAIALLFYGSRNALHFKHCIGNGTLSWALQLIIHLYLSM